METVVSVGATIAHIRTDRQEYVRIGWSWHVVRVGSLWEYVVIINGRRRRNDMHWIIYSTIIYLMICILVFITALIKGYLEEEGFMYCVCFFFTAPLIIYIVFMVDMLNDTLNDMLRGNKK